MHGDRPRQPLPRSDFDFDLGLRLNLYFDHRGQKVKIAITLLKSYFFKRLKAKIKRRKRDISVQNCCPSSEMQKNEKNILGTFSKYFLENQQLLMIF